MRFVLPVFAKLNLSLRVTGRRPDGYHELVSAFLRIPTGETLFVSPLGRGGRQDVVEVRGLDAPIEGENIVCKALRLAREAGARVPHLRVEIAKALPPGSGLGSGSGNAAALLRWLAPRQPRLPWAEVARRVGADVPFLFSGYHSAKVLGTGERIEPLASMSYSYLGALVALPDWDVGTEGAYATLDRFYRDGYLKGEEGALWELERVYYTLVEGERAGLLPNDFLGPLTVEHPQYEELFELFRGAGALGWGVSGSGSAAFALFKKGRGPRTVRWPAWVRQVLFLPGLP